MPFSLTKYVQLRREQWLSITELRSRQWKRLQKILRHAYANTTHYKRAFDAAEVSPDDIRTAKDLERLPILRKDDLRRPQEIVVRGSDLDAMRSSFTSGSTGEGLRTYFDPGAWMLGRHLLKLRARLACGVRPWDRIAQFQWIPNKDTFIRRRLLRQKSFGIDLDFESVIPSVRRYAPTVLYGFPGYLNRLGKVAAGRITARIVFTSGEMLDDETRRSIEESFGATVLDIYGCTEMKEVAWECPERQGYHINADWFYVEVLRKAEADAPKGSLVITSLYNYGMPLIRYLVGDIGHLLDQPCRCGRGLPLMAPATGRAVDYVRLPGGGEVSPYTVMTPVEAHPGVEQFEVIQEEIDHAVVRVLPSARYNERTMNELKELLEPILPGIKIETKKVERIEPQAGGKYRIVQSKV